MIGRILSNRYKLIAELGSGGMAWVYLAEDLVRQQKVAVKVLYPQHSQDLGFLQRFAREAKLSMALTQAAPQKNIVRLLDYGADRDTHYLVMEYVPGEDLGQRLETEGALPWQTALTLARQVALALDHAHCYDIVHRDIKPSNIMIMPDDTVRVLDFGIARARTSPEVTLSGFVGSPNYAAPEQATGKPVDIRADIYSLGIVLYRMLSGRLPFQGDTAWEVINRHISATPPPLAQLCPGLPQVVIELVAKAMAKRAEDRFQTPAQMVAAIEAALAGQPVPALAAEVGRQEPGPELEALYRDARQAMEAEHWQEAVDLLSRCLKIDPDYRDVSAQLSAVGQQIQLAALYRSARRALERGQWQRALKQLTAIAAIDPDYKEIADLRDRAERQEALPGAEEPRAEFVTHAEAAGPVSGPPPADRHPAPAAEHEERQRWCWDRRFLWAGIPLALLLLAATG
jgi:serine/threonine protein kinase